MNTLFKNTGYKKRLTPLMGWASWNNYRININENLLKQQIDALISTGLAEVGYTYFNIDDGFFGGRDEDGFIKPHPKRFPNGMKVIADYAHSKGLKAGIYSEAGDNTCAHIYDNEEGNTDGIGVGLYGYDEQDLRMYLIDWDYDFIKVDWCGGLRLGLDEQTRYTEIGKIIEQLRQEKNSDIIYNVCRWEFPGEWVTDIADSWRVSADISLDFSSLLQQIDAVKSLSQYHGPGHINDLDILQVGRGLTYEEDKTHFAMWCMMSTPLMLGNDLTIISEETLSIIKNTDLIAINQDPACLQATLVATQGNIEVWVKDLGTYHSNQKAIALLNRGDTDESVSINWNDFGFVGNVKVRDLWHHIDQELQSEYTVSVPAHGTAVYKAVGEINTDSLPLSFIDSTYANYSSTPIAYINSIIADTKLQKGAVLLDVRTLDEFIENPIPNAINLPHINILREVESIISDKTTEVIIYCTTGKRALQAKNNLHYLGYSNVHILK